LKTARGPGYATADLGEIVGPQGEVLGLERSARFVAAARRRCAQRGLTNTRIDEVDLMADANAATGFDAAWCRRVDSSFADAVESELDLAERDPSTIMITPLVLEIIAERQHA
jgi:protein-L-isoaspartate O-methyltransferase